MCGGALFWSQISKVVFGATDDKRGCGKLGNIYHPKTELVSGVLASACAELMKSFFKSIR
jgi:tRNA(adenine34) deaminase